MHQILEVVKLVCLEGGEDEVQHHLPVSPCTFVQLLDNLWVLLWLRYRGELKLDGGTVLCLACLLDLVSEQPHNGWGGVGEQDTGAT